MPAKLLAAVFPRSGCCLWPCAKMSVHSNRRRGPNHQNTEGEVSARRVSEGCGYIRYIYERSSLLLLLLLLREAMTDDATSILDVAVHDITLIMA